MLSQPIHENRFEIEVVQMKGKHFLKLLDMTPEEIAGLLKRNLNTVYTHLNRGKELLKQSLGGVWIG